MKKEIELNVMQIAAVMANQRYKIPNITIEAGRGTGKSTVLGWFIKEGVRQMPRSTGVIVGSHAFYFNHQSVKIKLNLSWDWGNKIDIMAFNFRKSKSFGPIRLI